MAGETPYIIDCHIHPGVDGEADTNWFASSGDIQAQFDDLRRAGISRACGAPIRGGAPDSFAAIRSLNDQALILRDRFPEFYVPGIQVHPGFADESCREIERCCGDQEVRWVGELVGYIMGYGSEYASDQALPIMQAAAAHNAVVNIHCGELEVVEALCTAVPQLNVVLAHPGDGKDRILERLQLVASLPNLHLDISGSGIDRYGVLRRAVEVTGKDKLLFGTDFPINNPAVYVHGALFEALGDETSDALFHGNFLRLTGYSEKA